MSNWRKIFSWELGSEFVTYVYTDDWYIIARGRDGRLYYVNTELWPEWNSIPAEEIRKPGAVEKYMLPIALDQWDKLFWNLVRQKYQD